MSFINKLLSAFLGNKSDRDMKEIQPLLDLVKSEYPAIQQLSNDELRAKTVEFKSRINEYVAKDLARIDELKAQTESEEIGVTEKENLYTEIDSIEKLIITKTEEVILEILPQAFSVVKETAKRFTENEIVVVTATDFDRDLAAKYEFVTIEGNQAHYKNSWLAGGTMIKWAMVHYDVQLIGGIVLSSGKISEMGTGEGKTLVATLPVYLNALPGKGVHVVTVNDYLAKRDSEWMGPIFQFHGLSVDCIDKHQPNSPERKLAYDSDITYGTNNEFGFDYLRDNMATSPKDLVQRKHNYGIVDEVDSVLIDDARTPLIISGPVPKGDDQLFVELKPKVEQMVEAQRSMFNKLLVDAKSKIASSNDKEREEGALLLLRSYKALPKNKALIKYLSEPGMKALLIKTENIYMQENNKNMHIVTDPLYFVIMEQQNSIELTEKGIDLITGSSNDAHFFVLPDIATELAMLEKEAIDTEAKLQKKEEIIQNYSIKSERVHTINQLLKAYTLFEKDVEYVVMDNKVKIVDEQTGRIMDGRRYSDGLHQAIEAKERVKVEAATQTYATITLQNYFRMYSKLAGMTGTAETEAGELWNIYKLDVVVIPTNRPISRKDYEDKIYKTKREKYNAVIEEISTLVQAGRPVLVGTTSVEISELLSRMLKLRGIKHNVLNAKLHQKEADIVAEAGTSGVVTIATNMAGRGTDIKLSAEVKAAGGLAIIGTERHESRRVDRQLRGRAGRQGDVGSSQFFVSLEDNLMRLFGSDRIVKYMDRLGIEEGEMIQHSMITKSIERAQKKVEENNFGIRKRLLEYDDVMNSQREVIYTKRRHALYGERVSVDISNMIYDTCDHLIQEHQANQDHEGLKIDVIKYFSSELEISEKELLNGKHEDLTERLFETVSAAYKRRSLTIANQAYPIIKEVYEQKAHMYENIVVPMSDGLRIFSVNSNLKKAYDTKGADVVNSFEKAIMLVTIDEAWKEHLRELDDLRQSVQNASYEQKDPLLIYKFESFNLFKGLMERNNKAMVGPLFKSHIVFQNSNQVQEAKEQRLSDLQKLKIQKDDFSNQSQGGGMPNPSEMPDRSKAQPIRVEKKVGRNDPCPCGSGKKFKVCHGKDL